ncbi:MAG: peptidase M48 [Zetaproteobacteria bacterium CG12_big_fil_rev_8_21_14_0_65_54_13]|nr:MAG: peptidase M48 [Zetaproteobacteria bacterium CG12_big_fil_rev_8_21_14_0_65_54_13]PIX55369.1 MAG: peptidase M48 [Zetaproteobacteria bacterium CG_4_10_14_3_um_filter_54_28]PJA27106.1 MAG: peptidase M48 [Zetaproteobacteria bacterium CG_4_9_14_3_um_filter_54_145]
MTIWTSTVLLLAVTATVTGLYLSWRQKSAVRAHRERVPAAFADNVQLAAHQKAADYTAARLKLEDLSQVIGLILLLAWTLGGGLNLLDGITGSFGLPGAWGGVAFMLLFFLISQLLDLPVDIYRTFAIEARFGFNKVTPALYLGDMAKQTMLMLVIGTPLLWVMLALMQGAGEQWWLYAWMVWGGFMLLMIWAYPTLIAPLFNSFEPLPDGAMKTRIEALLSRCGFHSNGLYVMDGSRRSSHGNAYFTGLGKAKRIVFFDTLIKQLQAEETEAVLAHELGHFHHGHVKRQIVIMLLMSLIGFALLGWVSQQTWFYTGLGMEQASSHAALTLFLLIMPAFTFVLTPMMNRFSRRNEFEADAYAVANSNGAALISSLVKMYEDNASTLTPDPLYSAWHDSHPPAPIRINHIEKCMSGSSL